MLRQLKSEGGEGGGTPRGVEVTRDQCLTSKYARGCGHSGPGAGKANLYALINP